MNRSFIGITDFTSPDQVRQMLTVLESCNRHHKLGVGVMMSRKTLLGLPTKYTNVFPKKETLAGIYIDHPRVFNVLHFADYRPGGECNDLLANLDAIVKWCGPNLHAIQLDMTWPSPDALALFRKKHSNIKLILQVGVKALKQIDESNGKLIERLQAYASNINYILVDRSMGKGVPLSHERLLPIWDAIALYYPDIGLVAAGGLGPTSVGLIEPLTWVFPEMCTDAQGKLRPSGNFCDPIDWKMAADYLRAASQILD